MAINLGHSFLCVLSLCLIISPIGCYAQYFFIFGDSLYDPGNNIFVTPEKRIPAYYYPYGSTFFDHPTGRYSDGRVPADFIAAKLNLPFMPPALDPNADFTHGANFASGGGGVTNENPEALNFEAQYQKFKGVKEIWTKQLNGNTVEVQKRLAEAVYLVCMGGNDYFSFSLNNEDATIAEMQAQVNKVQTQFKAIVKKIYDAGARKFMFQNVAPIGCLPMFRQRYNISGDGCAPTGITIASLHNAVFQNLLESLAEELPGFTYSIFDYFTAIRLRISKPEEYGFKGGSISCCGHGTHRASHCGTFPYCVCSDPKEYVFWDGGHNSDAANQQLADLMWSKDSGYVAPKSIKELFEINPIAHQLISSRKSGWLQLK